MIKPEIQTIKIEASFINVQNKRCQVIPAIHCYQGSFAGMLQSYTVLDGLVSTETTGRCVTPQKMAWYAYACPGYESICDILPELWVLFCAVCPGVGSALRRLCNYE